MIGAIVGEYFGGAFTALGVLINSRSTTFQFKEAWAGIGVACAFGIAFYLAVALVERLALRGWHRQATDRGSEWRRGFQHERGPHEAQVLGLRDTCCGCGDRGSGRRRRHESGGLDEIAEADQGDAPAEVGYSGAVRGLLRREGQGYYKAQGLDVRIKSGGPSIIPEQVVAGGQAEFGIDWLSSLMTRPRPGRQPRQHRAGLRQERPDADHVEGHGHQHRREDEGKESRQLARRQRVRGFRGAREVRDGSLHNKGVTIVAEPFSMDFFLKRQADAASAMTYNELAQVLEAKNPKTGKLYQLKDLNVIPMQKVGTSMLEDGIFVRGDWIKSKSHQALSKKFVAASLKGWIWCRDHLRDCVKIVLANGPALPKAIRRGR
jgi:hypothetical protein